MPLVTDAAPPASDSIASVLTTIAPHAQNIATVTNMLVSVGLGLSEFGDMLGMAPFSTAFKLVGKLFEVADAVQFNVENCNRVRRRVAALLPVLITTYKRVKLDPSCTVSGSINSCISTLSTTIQTLTLSLQEYADAGFFKRAFKSSQFKAAVDDAQIVIDEQLKVLSAAMNEDGQRKLDSLLTSSKELTVDVNGKLDELLVSMSGLSVDVVQMKEMLEKMTRDAMDEKLAGRSDLILAGVTDLEGVKAYMMTHSDRKVFVRDMGFKGPGALYPGGPVGHHYSCDFLYKPTGDVHSFRFTQRDADGKFVMDRDHFHQLDSFGYIHIMGSLPSKPFNPSTAPVHISMFDLLMSVTEVCEASGMTKQAMYH